MRLPPTTKLELQLKYGVINLNNQLKTSWREVLKQSFTEKATVRLEGRVECEKGGLHSHRQWLKFQRDTSVAKLSPDNCENQSWAPSSEHQKRKEVPTKHLAVKISRDSVHQGEAVMC